MKPLIDSPGHVRALTALVDLTRFGPKEMLRWDLGRGWDHFLAGRAALALTWGDLGALAQQPGSRVRGKVGAAQLPGVREYYDIGAAPLGRRPPAATASATRRAAPGPA